MTHDRDQLERLLSERLDGRLAEAQLVELDRALAADAGLARAQRQYARLAKLLAGWRALPADVDWERFAARFSEAVRAAGHDRVVDDALKAWAAPLPPVDWNATRQRFSRAVRQAQESTAATTTVRIVGPRRRLSGPGILRLFVPLAAAAVLVLGVWRPFGPAPSPPAAPPARITVVLQTPERCGTVSIHFEEDGGEFTMALGDVVSPQPAALIATSFQEPSSGEPGEAAVAMLYSLY